MENLKEKLICSFKNAKVVRDNSGNYLAEGFSFYSCNNYEHKEEVVKTKTWYGKTKEKVIYTKLVLPKTYSLWFKKLPVEISEEEYNDLKNHLKTKYEQQVIEELDELCE